MESNQQQTTQKKFYAGLCLRVGGRTRFWGWGNPPMKEVEQPWSSVADWLRVAHSSTLFNSRAVVSAESGKVQLATLTPEGNPAVQEPEEKRKKVEFVCDRHFIGLLVR